jgi:uncharacterized membrane protein YbhN (UPF0104 family)
MKISKTFRNIIAGLIAIVIFYFLGRSLYHSWGEVVRSGIRFNLLYAFISILFFQASSFATGLTWQLTLRLLGADMPYWQAVRVIAVSLFGKYLPGKIWAFGGRILLSKQRGVGEAESSTALLIETVGLTFAAFFIFFCSLIFYRPQTLPAHVYWSLILLPIGVFLMHPKILTAILKTLARLTKRTITVPKFNYLSLIKLYFYYLLLWTIHALGFFFLTQSIFPASYKSIMPIIGAYSVSWILGFLVLISPGGLGVREGLLAFFLKFAIPTPIATLMALISRIWITIGEVLFLVLSLIKKEEKSGEKQNAGKA